MNKVVSFEDERAKRETIDGQDLDEETRRRISKRIRAELDKLRERQELTYIDVYLLWHREVFD